MSACGSLRATLAAAPLARVTRLDPAPGVGLDSVVRWHDLDSFIARNVRAFAHGKPMRMHQVLPLEPDSLRPDPFSLTRTRRVAEWTCDIGHVAGLVSSKADLHTYGSLREFAQTDAAEYLGDRSHAALQEALSHHQIRIGRSPGAHARGDCFLRFGWDQRLFLGNSGGSHHFVAAQHIAGELGVAVPLYGPLYEHLLVERSVRQLCAQYRMFVLGFADLGRIHEALQADRVEFLTGPWDGQIGIEKAAVCYLPAADGRSAAAADLLAEAGAVDLGARLRAALDRQLSLSTRA